MHMVLLDLAVAMGMERRGVSWESWDSCGDRQLRHEGSRITGETKSGDAFT